MIGVNSVYILLCSDNTLYTGVTNELELRVHQHNEGQDMDSYTFKRRPCELVFHHHFESITQAIDFEKQIKGWRRKKKEALINCNWEYLPELAKCLNETSHLNRDKSFVFDSAQTDTPENS